MIKETEKIVMYDSPEAATYRTDIKGWVSRDGHFYGDNGPSAEHGARWSGCTHMNCKCGTSMRKESPLPVLPSQKRYGRLLCSSDDRMGWGKSGL